MTDRELLEKAKAQLPKAYAPYSNFKVGAVVETEEGDSFSGCNVECAVYGAGICAERTALVKAISEGHRHITSLAVVSSSDDFTYPCGICRQMLMEFNPELRVIVGNQKGEIRVHSLKELLPEAFTAADLEKNQE